jgi:lipopolysaccharide export system permease protein
MGNAIGAVFALRMAGFACSVAAAKSDWAAPLQYALLFGTIFGSLAIIKLGIVIEPPAKLIEAINRSNERILRLFRRPVAA